MSSLVTSFFFDGTKSRSQEIEPATIRISCRVHPKSRPFFHHEMFAASWNHQFSVMKKIFASWNPQSVMKRLYFPHGIFYSVMNSNARHEKNSPSWITYNGMKCIIFPSWNFVPSVMNWYNSSSVYLIQPPRVGLMDSWMHPSCTRSLIKPSRLCPPRVPPLPPQPCLPPPVSARSLSTS